MSSPLGIFSPVLLTLFLPRCINAQTMPGMQMSPGMSGEGMSGMTGATGSMTPYLHFSPLTDTLWFQYWVPETPGTLIGACIGLFMLAIFERWLAAGRAVAERSWSRSAQLVLVDLPQPGTTKESPSPSLKSQPDFRRPNTQPKSKRKWIMLGGANASPFITSHDISRGILQIAQAALAYLFMLAVMSYQLGFIIALCLGAGVGEMMFGRYISAASQH